MNCLGEIVFSKKLNEFGSFEITTISNILQNKCPNKIVHVLIPSTNALKVKAAKEAVERLLAEILGEKEILKWKIDEKGIECESGVAEQPHGFEITKNGAETRLFNLRKQVAETEYPTFYVSMENGLIIENFSPKQNKNIFEIENGKTWIDRTVVVVEFQHLNLILKAIGLSLGVTTPVEQVLEAEKSNWTKTAGSFIGKKYGVDPKNWHTFMCGKSREEIMKDSIKNCLGLPFHSIPIPVESRNMDIEDSEYLEEDEDEIDDCLYNKYNNHSIDFFVPKRVDKLLSVEKKIKKKKSGKAKQSDLVIKERDVESGEILREYFQVIPQSSKPGADLKNSSNSLSPNLTEDLLTMFPLKINGEIIWHCLLTWAKQDDEYKDFGWTLPGKRDRCYAKENPDICVEDANIQLLNKNLGIQVDSIYHHETIAFFDDRVREQRMRSSGFFSVVILDGKPVFDQQRMIAVPLNILKKLVDHELRIFNPFVPNSNETYGLVRNHDSFLKSIFETTKFYNLIENLKIVHGKWNDALKNNPNAPLPNFPEFEAGNVCQICDYLLVDSKIICDNGHTVCGLCAKPSSLNGKCPYCRKSLLSPMIKNRTLDQIIQNNYPKQYKIRYHQLTTTKLESWVDHPIFKGNDVQFK